MTEASVARQCRMPEAELLDLAKATAHVGVLVDGQFTFAQPN